MKLQVILLSCLVVIGTLLATAQSLPSSSSSLHPNSECGQNIAGLDPAASKSLLHLLNQCQKTKDGMVRDCCSLVYPKIHQSRHRRSPYHHPQNFYHHHHHHQQQHHNHNFRSHGGIYAPWFTIEDSSEFPSHPPAPSSSSPSGCHSLTQNLAPSTQNLLHRCCYIQPEIGLKVGLDCLALTFPTVPAHMRCGQCTRPGTVEDLVYECCQADDGIERNCCAMLEPFRNNSSGDEKLLRPFCPCPRKSGKNKIVLEKLSSSQEEFRAEFQYSRNKCHPSTLNISTATQRLLNKCCLTSQATGKQEIDCLKIAFPSIPWQQRCGACDSDLPPKDLLNECCGTPDGISRDCCELVYPKLAKDKRFCPCSSQGRGAPENMRQNYFRSVDANAHSSHQVPSFLFALVRSLSREDQVGRRRSGDHGQCPLVSPEHAINLHTYCCNTHGKKEYGFNCEQLVLGKEPEHGNRPCGASSNTLEPKTPTITGSTDYLDYEDEPSNDY